MKRRARGSNVPRRDAFPSWHAYRDAVEAHGLADGNDVAYSLWALTAIEPEELPADLQNGTRP